MRSAPLWALVALACAAEAPGGGGDGVAVSDRDPEALIPAGVVEEPAALAETEPPQEAWLDRYDFDDRLWYVDLPGQLDEVSGLAISGGGRLFAHDDERGRVHEIDPATGDVGIRFDLGDPMALDDFEGIAIVEERFFMVSSAGLLYEFREASDREDVEYRVTDTGVGRGCEVEGLEYDPEDDALVLACKTTSPSRGSIVLERVSLEGGRRLDPILVERGALDRWDVDTEFAPSGVVRTPIGTFLVLSARDDAIIEVDRTGTVVAAIRLSGGRHPQSEGIVVGPDAVLYVADEKNGKEPRLTAYALDGAQMQSGPAGEGR